MPESELLRGYNSYLLYILAVSSVLTVAIILILTRLITDLLNPYQSKEKRLAYIMDNSWNEISIVDANTLKIIYLNNAALKNLGYTLAEIRNADISIISQNLREDLESGFLKPLISGEKKSLFINANRIRKNGTIYPIEAHIQYFKDENPPIFVTLAKDISEQENMQKLQNQFISMVSHELRTPLTSIRGSLSLLAAGMFGQMPDEAKNMLTIAHNSSIRLVNLINDILDFEKISAGKMEFKFESTELMPILEQAIIANQPYAQQYNVSFDITKNLPGIKVNIDSDRFIQVITNLLSNAAKYSEENRSVEIAAFKHNDMIRVSVTNYGSEISEEYKSRIFQQFSQADSAETRKKGGTGLGLSICKLIMEKLSGSIGFDSANTITTFFIELPEYSENN